MSKIYTDLILVGFGKHNLKDILSWMNTDREEELLTAFVKYPPVYRKVISCEPDEVEACFLYYEWLKKQILIYEQGELL